MEEREITIGDETYKLDEPFMVLATENPIEQEGTYPLPEAQLDRFFMKVMVEYPTQEEEKKILTQFKSIDIDRLKPMVTPAEIRKKAEIVELTGIDYKVISEVLESILTKENLIKELKKVYKSQ